MTRSFKNLQSYLAEFQDIAIPQRHKGILGGGVCAEINLRPHTVTQLKMSGDEIGVEVGQEHVAYLQPQPPCVFQVLVDIALRIDNHPSMGLFLPDQVRSVR